ncbi:polyphosphate polymerase domain-containing protein, partial [bacterium]
MNQNTWTPTRIQNKIQNQPIFQPGSVQSEPRSIIRLETLAKGFSPISLEEMDAVALLNRVDTKFVLPTGQLLQGLAMLRADYSILSVDEQRLNHYRTLYFDTRDFALYNMHVNEHADRFKVRSREYIDSQLAFLEVKHRTRKDRTIKSRISTGKPAMWIDSNAQCWLQGVFPYDSRALEPKLWNTFTRITLVNKRQCERVTIDVDLAFYTANRRIQLNGIAVAEVKQDGRDWPSTFLAQMQALKVHPQGFSKYCIGASLLYDQVKKNSLKAKLL